MKLATSLIIVAALASCVAAAPSAVVKRDIEARSDCTWAYDGSSPNKRGPGTLHSCSKTSFVVTLYICYVGSGPQYCCSGTPTSISGDLMVGGCFS